MNRGGGEGEPDAGVSAQTNAGWTHTKQEHQRLLDEMETLRASIVEATTGWSAAREAQERAQAEMDALRAQVLQREPSSPRRC